MLLTSVWITSRSAIPPPRRIIEIDANTRSVLGYADAFFNGIVSPSFSSCGDGFGGTFSSMCCEPRMLVWPIFAVALAGNFTPGCKSRVSVGTQFFSWIALTEPTYTSATRTRLLTLSANVSGIWT